MKPITLPGLATALLACALLFGLLELAFAAAAQRPWLRFQRMTDVIYWFATPLLTRFSTLAALSGIFAVIAYFTQLPSDVFEFAAAMHARAPLGGLPVWLQLVVALVLGDCLMYANHRLFHHGWLWRVHAVHHSSEDLDWLASVRIHPINDLPNKLVTVLPLLFLGIEIKVFAAVVPFMQLWTVLLHSNVGFRFGWLGYLVTTPAYHRWHHAKDADAIDKNFAGMFPVWDMLFGTYYMPRGKRPSAFGVDGETIPPGFLGQLALPFRAPRRLNPRRE